MLMDYKHCGPIIKKIRESRGKTKEQMHRFCHIFMLPPMLFELGNTQAYDYIGYALNEHEDVELKYIDNIESGNTDLSIEVLNYFALFLEVPTLYILILGTPINEIPDRDNNCKETLTEIQNIVKGSLELK